MKILMLGWEYPPHISGGLGTACEGLTRGLAELGTEIIFVVPTLFGDEPAEHMSLIGAGDRESTIGRNRAVAISKAKKQNERNIQTIKVPAHLSPYWSAKDFSVNFPKRVISRSREVPEMYGWDIFDEVTRYTQNIVSMLADEDFDIIHAHDWMTFPAAVNLSSITGKPLIVHVHSLEFDRSGANPNPTINEIEGWGVNAADAVVAVSYYTRSIIECQHNVPMEKIFVVHNGHYPSELTQSYRREQNMGSKVVLFLGRVTFQKGPDYFVEAAAKVISHVPGVKFVLAGVGDMLSRLIDRVQQLGISEYFYFPGFLKGADVERMYSIADVYVMPSVSEPFGITALEAVNYETPVIISRQSGVSEVLRHALKVDFWDVERMADLIINALNHAELRQDIINMAKEEIKKLHWNAAAQNLVQIYNALV